METKILVIGDPHFKISKFPQRQQLMVSEITTKAQQIKPQLIVVLGDVMNDHEKIHVSCLCPASQFLKDLAKIAKTYVLVGNHDLKNNKQFLVSEHSLTPLKDFPNLIIVDYPIRDGDLIFTPYVPPGRFEEALNKIADWQQARVIFAHQEFYGCDLDGMNSTEGDVWIADQKPLVVSGHIHKYHHLPGIIYPGTPMQHSFGEDSNKGLSLLTLTDSNIDHQRITLNIPVKLSLTISSNQIENTELPSGYEIRLEISGPPGENRGLRKHPKIKQWEQQGVKIIFHDTKELKQIPLTIRKVNYTERILQHLNDADDREDLLKILQCLN